jgi:hypothetical protein
MRYLCLVYYDEKRLDDPSGAERDALVDEVLAYREALGTGGHDVVADGLQPVETATTLRVRNGRVSTSDGPSAEATEQLAAFMLIEARDLNDAIRVASRIPLARLGRIEVRPVRELAELAGETRHR